MSPKEYYRTPYGKYIMQRANAQRRCINWDFDFPSWWKMWEDSGKWEQRGNKAGNYYMCRSNDIGPYSPLNCRIDTMSENALESWRVRRTPPADPFERYPRTSAWDYPHTSDWLRFSKQP